jgi:hypothetical protein
MNKLHVDVHTHLLYIFSLILPDFGHWEILMKTWWGKEPQTHVFEVSTKDKERNGKFLAVVWIPIQNFLTTWSCLFMNIILVIL